MYYLCIDNMGYMVASLLCSLSHYDLYETGIEKD